MLPTVRTSIAVNSTEQEGSIVERFAKNATAQDVLQRLTGNSNSSFKPYSEMLLREGIIQSLNDLIPVINQIEPQEKRVDAVRHALKEHYRSAVMQRIANPEVQLLQQRYPDQPWDNNPATAYNQARHQELMRVIKGLNSADRGNIAEAWYEQVYSQGRGSTHVSIPQDKMAEQGVAISQDRFADEVFGNTIREQKTIAGSLSQSDARNELAQFNDYIQVVSNPGGSQITKNGNTYTVQRLMYSFIDPKGVKANAAWMYDQILDHPNISFEIFNAQGERKIINQANKDELLEPALSNWLRLPAQK